MSDDQKDVLIAVYLFEDLAETDFDAVLKLVGDETITVEGVVLVQKDAQGEVHVKETGDHLGRKGLKIGGGVGLAVGLFAPPLLAAIAVGAAAGGVMSKLAKHRLRSEIAKRMDHALPPASCLLPAASQVATGASCGGAFGLASVPGWTVGMPRVMSSARRLMSASTARAERKPAMRAWAFSSTTASAASLGTPASSRAFCRSLSDVKGTPVASCV